MSKGLRLMLPNELTEQLLKEGKSIGLSDIKSIIIALLAEVRRLRKQIEMKKLNEQNTIDISSWK